VLWNFEQNIWHYRDLYHLQVWIWKCLVPWLGGCLSNNYRWVFPLLQLFQQELREISALPTIQLRWWQRLCIGGHPCIQPFLMESCWIYKANNSNFCRLQHVYLKLIWPGSVVVKESAHWKIRNLRCIWTGCFTLWSAILKMTAIQYKHTAKKWTIHVINKPMK